jgi:hypothetical protein
VVGVLVLQLLRTAQMSRFLVAAVQVLMQLPPLVQPVSSLRFQLLPLVKIILKPRQ